MEKLVDFGEKIGGARKDLWGKEGLGISDLETLNEAESEKYVTKPYIWPIPSAKEQVEAGTDVFVAYWQRRVRNLAFPAPHIHRHATKMDAIEAYINAMSDLRNHVMSCRTQDDIGAFEAFSVKNKYDILHWSDAANVSKIRSLQWKKSELRLQMERANFPEGKKRAVSKKKKFLPPQLERIERTGTDYRHGLHISPKRWQEEFGFRGVEFGNWCSQNDRRVSMDMCYDAFRDLAYALDIRDADIAFGGSLALAFGARGHSSASAHYEPLREVINLTKMRGAGFTAHEWAHALDDKLAKEFCGTSSGLASQLRNKERLPESFVRLVDALAKDADGGPTDYYRGSKLFDGAFVKDGHGYWTSPCEMFARAFACYVKDCLGEKSDYLIAHADCYMFEFDDQDACAIPQGEEREIFNEMFDVLFSDLKDCGFFHQREHTEQTVQDASEDVLALELEESSSGQLCMFF